MSENVIFCYSGTGNCLDMAKHIAHELGDTDIIMMRRKPAVTDVREAKRVGFVFPCYAGGLPEGVEESLRTIKATPYSYKFAVCQFAGYAGNGLAMVDRLFPLDYWRTVSHHCSCIWLFPHNVMSPPMSVEGAQKRSARVAKEVAQAAKQGVHRPKSIPSSHWSTRYGPCLPKRRQRNSPSPVCASAAVPASSSVRAATLNCSAESRSSAPTASSVSAVFSTVRRRRSRLAP